MFALKFRPSRMIFVQAFARLSLRKDKERPPECEEDRLTGF